MTSPTVTHLVRANDGATLVREAREAELLASALDSIDNLRAAMADGKVKAFFAVGLAADHRTYGWSGKRSPTTLLEMNGAWHSMANNIDGFDTP